MEYPNIEGKIVEFIAKKIELFLCYHFSSFNDRPICFRNGLKAIFFVKMPPNFLNCS